MWKLVFKSAWPAMVAGVLGVLSDVFSRGEFGLTNVVALVVVPLAFLVVVRVWMYIILRIETRRREKMFSRLITVDGRLDNTRCTVVTPDGMLVQ